MILKSKITRMTAFALSCLLIGFCAFRSVGAVLQYFDYRNQNVNEYYETLSEPYYLYDQLWDIGVMYLRNLDENGKFAGSDALKAQTVEYLTDSGIMDEKGNLKPDIPENYKVYVSWGKNVYTNTDETPEALTDGQYLTIRKGNVTDNMKIPASFGRLDIFDRNYHVTNYGMTYYYKNHSGTALFDFDTEGLRSYIDELGATMYYKTDGSMPIPDESYIPEQFDYDKTIYAEYEPDLVEDSSEIDPTMVDAPTDATDVAEDSENDVTEPAKPGSIQVATEPVEVIKKENHTTASWTEDRFVYSDENAENGYYYFDRESNTFVPVFREKQFTNELGSTKDLTIIIKPNEEALAAACNKIEGFHDGAKKIILQVTDCIPLGIIALILAVYVLIMGGYSTKEKKFVMEAQDRIYAELPIAMAGVIVICGILLINDDVIDFVRDIMDTLYTDSMTCWIYGIAYAALFAGLVLMLDTLFVRLKCRSFWKTTMLGAILSGTVKLVRKVNDKIFETTIEREMMRNDKAVRNFVVRMIMVVVGVIFSMLFSFAIESWIVFVFMAFVIFVGFTALSLLDLRDITRLYRHISDINNGNYEKKVVNREAVTYVPTEKLNNISDGIQEAVEKQVKSERMKIDLVTNVSHDLKTPLTSIISYIDLLSTEEMSPVARDYVSIIDTKSQRLKTMVADLFDLAKATSKTDINAEELDAVILTEQVLADLSDKIDASGREIRKDIQAETAPICADGKKMYRVFQNLIDNALKYSMAGTRVYVTLKNVGGNCVISVKNIASYEMNFAADEIMERFTRGDESRSTEGNGLGLSIAKSFTEACGGTFGVTIDGDVFIAELSLPLIDN